MLQFFYNRSTIAKLLFDHRRTIVELAYNYSVSMKQTIHPAYYHDAVVTCSCGNTFTTGSTKKEIHVELCSNCHPFFTGEMKFIDTMGRVEKFQARQAHATKLKETRRAKKVLKKRETRPETLREMMLREQRKLQKTSQPPKN